MWVCASCRQFLELKWKHNKAERSQSIVVPCASTIIMVFITSSIYTQASIVLVMAFNHIHIHTHTSATSQRWNSVLLHRRAQCVGRHQNMSRQMSRLHLLIKEKILINLMTGRSEVRSTSAFSCARPSNQKLTHCELTFELWMGFLFRWFVGDLSI